MLKFDCILSLNHLMVNDRSPLVGQPINDGLSPGARQGWREWNRGDASVTLDAQQLTFGNDVSNGSTLFSRHKAFD